MRARRTAALRELIISCIIIKVSLAAIPAAIAVSLVLGLIMSLFAGVFGGLGMMGPWMHGGRAL